jgi:hypothetical protein
VHGGGAATTTGGKAVPANKAGERSLGGSSHTYFFLRTFTSRVRVWSLVSPAGCKECTSPGPKLKRLFHTDVISIRVYSACGKPGALLNVHVPYTHATSPQHSANITCGFFFFHYRTSHTATTAVTIHMLHAHLSVPLATSRRTVHFPPHCSYGLPSISSRPRQLCCFRFGARVVFRVHFCRLDTFFFSLTALRQRRCSSKQIGLQEGHPGAFVCSIPSATEARWRRRR